GELRSINAHVCAYGVGFHLRAVAGFSQNLAELRTNRLVKTDVRDKTVPKERSGTPPGAVHELIGDEELERPLIFLERTHGTDRNDARNADRLQRVDVGAKVDFRGKNAVPTAMPCQKSHALLFQCTHYDSVGRMAKGCLHANLPRFDQARHRIETAAPDDADGREGPSGITLRLRGCHQDALSPQAHNALAYAQSCFGPSKNRGPKESR